MPRPRVMGEKKTAKVILYHSEKWTPKNENLHFSEFIFRKSRYIIPKNGHFPKNGGVHFSEFSEKYKNSEKWTPIFGIFEKFRKIKKNSEK